MLRVPKQNKTPRILPPDGRLELQMVCTPRCLGAGLDLGTQVSPQNTNLGPFPIFLYSWIWKEPKKLSSDPYHQ